MYRKWTVTGAEILMLCFSVYVYFRPSVFGYTHGDLANIFNSEVCCSRLMPVPVWGKKNIAAKCKHTEANNHIFQSMECRLSSIILTKIKATISSGQKDYSTAYLLPMPDTFKRMSLYCFVIDIQHLGICIYYPVPGYLILEFGH